MLLGEPFFLQIISPWLTLRDFVKLDSASCKELREGLLAHHKSTRFRDMYENQIRRRQIKGIARSIPILLGWIRAREVSIESVEIQLNDKLLEYLDQTTPQPYHFITNIAIRGIYLPNLLNLAHILLGCFPNTTTISIDNNQPTEASSFKGLVKALCILARSLPLKEIKFPIVGSVHFTPDVIRLLSDLMVIMGSNLEVLSFYNAVPSHLIETLVRHCPNAKSIFGDGLLASDVTLDMYVRACRSLPKLEVMANTVSFIMKDESLISLLPHLPCLKRISFRKGHSLTADSFLAVKQYLPLIQNVEMAGLQCTFSGRFQQVALEDMSLEDVRTGKIAEFIKRMLPFNKLQVMTEFRREAAKLLGPQLSALELSCVKCLVIDDPDSLTASTLLLHTLRYLETVEIEGYMEEDVEEGIWEEQMVLSDFLDTLCLHCPNVITLNLSGCLYFTDAMLDRVIKNLSNLQELSLPGTSQFLTKRILHSLAGTGKTWDKLHITTYRKLKHTDLVEAIDKYGLKTKVLEFELEFDDTVRTIAKKPTCQRVLVG